MDKMKLYESTISYHASGSLNENVAHSIYGTAKRTGKKEFIARSDGVSKEHALQNHHKKSPHTSNLYSDVHAVREGVEDDVKNAPFDGAAAATSVKKDRYGNTVKTKNIAKHLAKKGMKSIKEEDILDVLEALEEIEESLRTSHAQDIRQKQIKPMKDDPNGRKIQTPADLRASYGKGKKSVKEEAEIIEALEELDGIYETAIELQDVLEEAGVDIDELFSIDEDTVDESFAKMSKTKQLIARRRAGRSKKLTAGYHQSNARKAAKKATSIQKK